MSKGLATFCLLHSQWITFCLFLRFDWIRTGLAKNTIGLWIMEIEISLTTEKWQSYRTALRNKCLNTIFWSTASAAERGFWSF